MSLTRLSSYPRLKKWWVQYLDGAKDSLTPAAESGGHVYDLIADLNGCDSMSLFLGMDAKFGFDRG